MHLSKLRLTNLGPFDEIEFEFDEHVNVFTGPNNSGKSTVLMALGELTVCPFTLPRKLLRSEATGFKIELASMDKVFEGHIPLKGKQLSNAANFILNTVGYSAFVPALRRSTDFRAEAPTVTTNHSDHGNNHKVRRPHIQPGPQFKPSERDTTSEHGEEAEELLTLLNEVHKRRRFIPTDASAVSDEIVVQKIIELDYRAYRKDAPAIRTVIDKIATITSDITKGYPIRFVGVDEDENGLFPQFETPDGPVPLNVLSQGTQSLVQWLTRLLIDMAEYYDYPEDIEAKSGILIIDEIDAHLHPSWQRRIIPILTDHFPNLQIFCSTHSPLMLAGLKIGQVQLLDRDENEKVTVSRNEQDIVGWSADEILRSFLDVPNPTDLETVHNIERLQELRQLDNLTDEQTKELNRLRESVRRDLIGGPLATELEELRSILNEATSRSTLDSTPE